MTSGTLNARGSHAVNWKGTRWPRCRFADDGPCAGRGRAQRVSAGRGSTIRRMADALDMTWESEREDGGYVCSSCPRMQTGFSLLDGTADSGCAAKVRCGCIGGQMLQGPRRTDALVPGGVLSLDWAPAHGKDDRIHTCPVSGAPKAPSPGGTPHPTGVQVEWLAFLVRVQHRRQVAVRVEDLALEEGVRRHARQPLDAPHQRVVHLRAAELRPRAA